MKKIKLQGNIAGIDDATKSPCIGSIFLAGVVADPRIIRMWKKAGVKDSKLLTRKRREALEIMIRETAMATFVTEIHPATIDDKSLNLNDWEMLTVLGILTNLRRQKSIDMCVIDNWEVSEKVFNERYERLKNVDSLKLAAKNIELSYSEIENIQLHPQHFADLNYTVVGAASILAKCGSDRQYDSLRQKFGNFGSGAPGDPKTREFVWVHRKNPVSIIRQSWQTFKDLSVIERMEDDWLFQLRAERKLKKKVRD